ncbi:MAG: glycosyltransferase, partial [Flavobacteriales bacterium]|nr:glycosyltransferase [Flavobacteriales bacterium]
QKQFLQRAIESVINQGFTDYELIIIDGKSEDGTIDVIKQYENKISYWESAEDRNVYDAMNKAVAQSNGDWLYFLGADDEICKTTFQNIFSQNTEDTNLIFGNIIYQNKEEFKGEFSNKLFIKKQHSSSRGDLS